MKSNTAAGLAFALIGFVLLASGDAIVKSIGGMWPGTAIAALRYTIGALVLVPLLYQLEGRPAFSNANWRLQSARGLAVAISAICFFTALAFMPLAEATVISFLNPLFSAFFSSFFLGEKAPKSAIFASLAALIGVILVMRPNFAHVGFTVLLPVIAAIGMALLMVLNRQVAGSASVLSMQAFVSLTGAGILIFFTVLGHVTEVATVTWPSNSIIIKCAIVAFTATFAHTFIYLATTRASAALVAPMTYVQLLVALAIGYLMFNNFPDTQALWGSALIIGSGLYLWWTTRTKQA